MKLDLKTLKYLKLSFELCSDNSTRCHGYNYLCELINKNRQHEENRIKIVTTKSRLKVFVNDELKINTKTNGEDFSTFSDFDWEPAIKKPAKLFELLTAHELREIKQHFPHISTDVEVKKMTVEQLSSIAFILIETEYNVVPEGILSSTAITILNKRAQKLKKQIF